MPFGNPGIENFPVESVNVPLVELLIKTLAPGRASFVVALVTLPEMLHLDDCPRVI